MTKTLNLARIAVILLFAMTFTLIGWTAPVLYASSVPSDEVIEVHNFEAQDTTTESDMHYICFDRTVWSGSSAYVFTELYLIDDNGDRVEVQSDSMQRYFQQGRTNVVTPMDLPDNLRAGEYRYVIVVKMDMADGRVTREFAFESDKFNITEGPAMSSPKPPNCQ